MGSIVHRAVYSTARERSPRHGAGRWRRTVPLVRQWRAAHVCLGSEAPRISAEISFACFTGSAGIGVGFWPRHCRADEKSHCRCGCGRHPGGFSLGTAPPPPPKAAVTRPQLGRAPSARRSWGLALHIDTCKCASDFGFCCFRLFVFLPVKWAMLVHFSVFHKSHNGSHYLT